MCCIIFRFWSMTFVRCSVRYVSVLNENSVEITFCARHLLKILMFRWLFRERIGCLCICVSWCGARSQLKIRLKVVFVSVPECRSDPSGILHQIWAQDSYNSSKPTKILKASYRKSWNPKLPEIYWFLIQICLCTLFFAFARCTLFIFCWIQWFYWWKN